MYVHTYVLCEYVIYIFPILKSKIKLAPETNNSSADGSAMV
jgi:hypothetical protein